MVFLAQIEIMVIAILAGSLCSIFGSIILLQKKAYMPLTISRSAILGFALGFFISTAFSSLPLIILASIVGVVSLVFITKICKYFSITDNAFSIAVSSFIFAIGIIIIRLYSFNKFTEDDRIFTGELVYTTFNRLIIFETDIGATSLYLFLILFIVNLLVIYLYYYQLKAYTFDKDYATTIWIDSKKLDMMVIVMMSITVAASIQVTGAFMVSVFILGPAAISYFFVKRISSMIISSVFICFVSSLSGIKLAYAFNTTIVSAIVIFIALLFFLAFLFAPETGFIYYYLRKRKAYNETVLCSLLLYMYDDNDKGKMQPKDIADCLGLNNLLANKITKLGLANRSIFLDDKGYILLTDTGRNIAIDTINKL